MISFFFLPVSFFWITFSNGKLVHFFICRYLPIIHWSFWLMRLPMMWHWRRNSRMKLRMTMYQYSLALKKFQANEKVANITPSRNPLVTIENSMWFNFFQYMSIYEHYCNTCIFKKSFQGFSKGFKGFFKKRLWRLLKKVTEGFLRRLPGLFLKGFEGFLKKPLRASSEGLHGLLHKATNVLQ